MPLTKSCFHASRSLLIYTWLLSYVISYVWVSFASLFSYVWVSFAKETYNLKEPIGSFHMCGSLLPVSFHICGSLLPVSFHMCGSLLPVSFHIYSVSCAPHNMEKSWKTNLHICILLYAPQNILFTPSFASRSSSPSASSSSTHNLFLTQHMQSVSLSFSLHHSRGHSATHTLFVAHVLSCACARARAGWVS